MSPVFSRRCSHHRQTRCYSRPGVARSLSLQVLSAHALPHAPVRSRASLDVISEDFRINALRRRKQLIPRAKLISRKSFNEGKRGYSDSSDEHPQLRRTKTSANLAEFIAEHQLLGQRSNSSSPNIVELFERAARVEEVSPPSSTRSPCARVRKTSSTSLASRSRFKMSRRPQVLHVTDSVNSRQRNRTYTKNTVLKASPVTTVRSKYDISDWETYSVMSQSDDVQDEDRGDEVSKVEAVENIYATINKRRDSEVSKSEDGFDTIDLATKRDEGLGDDVMKTLDPLRVSRHNSMETRRPVEVAVDVVVDGGDEACVEDKEVDVKEVDGGHVDVELTGMDKLREITRVEGKGLDASLAGVVEGAKSTLVKEKSSSMLNLNSSDQCKKIRFKKLGSKIETQVNNFNKRGKSNETEGSINRSMPEFLNENFTIENPLFRFRAIESHLEHISKMNNGKVQNYRKTSVDVLGSNNVNAVGDAQKIDKVKIADKNFNLKLEKLRANENPHEKVVKSKSNEESNSKSDDSFKKVAAFDGLLQYLQDYRLGLRDLLVNNNVVIIEPLRESAVRLEDAVKGKPPLEKSCRITGATVKNSKPPIGDPSRTLPRSTKHQPKIKRHFFYHPCNRVNRYLVDKELPDPDLVKNGREKYEEFLKLKIEKEKVFAGFGSDTLPAKLVHKSSDALDKTKTSADSGKRKLCRFLTVDTVYRDKAIRRWTDTGSLSSGISSDLSCYDTDLESPNYDLKTFSSDDDDFDSLNSKNFEVEYHYVAPEVLEKIRACGESTTYYGGRIVASTKGQSPMNCIMSEIQEDTRQDANRNYLGVKFRLVKSNSCGSRLELAGTDEAGKTSPRDNSAAGKARAFGAADDKSGAECDGTPMKEAPISSEECVTTGTGTGENGMRQRAQIREDIPKINIQRVIKEIEAKQGEKTKSDVVKRSGSFHFAKNATTTTTTAAAVVAASGKEIEHCVKEEPEPVVVEKKTNFLGGAPLEAIRGGTTVYGTKGRSQFDRPKTGVNGFGGRVCDMEFETFEVLESLGTGRSNEDASEEVGKRQDGDGACRGDEDTALVEGVEAVLKEKIHEELKAEIDKMKTKEATPGKEKVQMTSWSKQKQSVTFDFRNDGQMCQNHLPSSNHSLC